MKALFMLMLFCLFAVPATPLAEADWEIKAKYLDYRPNDGWMDVGSISNPYEVRDSSGEIKATIKSKYLDFRPNDGYMEAGTIYNPFVIEWE